MKRILWVDDEPEYTRKWLLVFEGHKKIMLRAVVTGAQALRQISESVSWNLLIVDLYMASADPNLDDGVRYGVDLYQHFRRRNPKVQVMMFTSGRDNALFEQLRNADPNLKILRKRDYDPQQFLIFVQDLLGL